MIALFLACISKEEIPSQPERPVISEPPTPDRPMPVLVHPRYDPARQLPEKMVVVVVVDGVRVEEFSSEFASELTGVPGESWATSVWSDIAPLATLVRAAIIPGITTTGPSHATLLTGTTPALANLAADPQVTSLYRPEIPTLLQLAEQKGNTLFIGNTNLLSDAGGSVYPGYAATGSFQTVLGENVDHVVLETARTTIESKFPILTVINLHDVDIEGHEGETGTYSSQIKQTEQQVVEFFKMLKENPDIASRMLFILTSDHGRHRQGSLTPIWQEHGDACSGCREVPLFLAGPGITEGEELDLLWTEQDTNQVISAYLGLENPFGQGLLAETVLSGSTARAGYVSIQSSMGHSVYQVWQDDPDHRSRIEVNGEVVSSPLATFAERPTIAATATDMAVCWRELTIDPEEDWWPWVPRCVVRSIEGELWGEWKDIGFITGEVSHTFRPSLLWNKDALIVAWSDLSWSEGSVGEDSVQISTYQDGIWESIGSYAVQYPTYPKLMWGDRGWGVVAGASTSEANAREQRHILFREERGSTCMVDFDGLLDNGDSRAERAAVRTSGGQLWLAAVVIAESGTGIAAWGSNDGGHTWSLPTLLPTEGSPLPSVSPEWDGEWLVWAVQFDKEHAGLCKLHVANEWDAESPICTPLDSAWIDSLGVSNGLVTVSSYQGDGQWGLTQFAL